MKPQATLLLTGNDVRRLLSLDECIAVVETAFRLHGEGKTSQPGVLGVHVPNGGFHIKAGVLELKRRYFAAKVNGNFPNNASGFGLPTIQGVIVLADAENGCPLAVIDSVEITALRTAAATAVAAKYLARKDSRVATICGCGVQGAFQLRALCSVLKIDQAYACDIDFEKAVRFAKQLGADLGIKINAGSRVGTAARQSDVCITCTTSRRYFLKREDVKAGTFVAAVGADNPEKQEIAPALMAESKIVTDVHEQSATIGDLHHALQAGVITMADVHAELGEVVAGKKAGRTSENEVIVFDSTGMALQDVATAAIVYEKAVVVKSGVALDFVA
jgi:alanine dehydrogenase